MHCEMQFLLTIFHESMVCMVPSFVSKFCDTKSEKGKFLSFQIHMLLLENSYAFKNLTAVR